MTAIFASDEFYWAKTLPLEAMKEMLENSLTFGLYEIIDGSQFKNASINGEHLRFVGIARCVTDYVTFVYVTDVWIDPTYQGKGLGSWLIQCVQSVLIGMPHLRRSLLFTADWQRSVPFYERLMDMKVIEVRHGQGLAIMERKGQGHPSFGKDSTGY